MKKLIVLIYFLPLLSLAQNWCPPGAQWVYNTGDAILVANTLIQYAGDTVIDNYPAQRLDQNTRYTYWVTGDTLFDLQGPSFFTRNEWRCGGEWTVAVWDSCIGSVLYRRPLGAFWLEYNQCSGVYWW